MNVRNCERNSSIMPTLVATAIAALIVAQPLNAQAEPNFLSLQRAIARLSSAPIATADSFVVKEVRDQIDEFEKYLKEVHSGSPEDVAAIQHLTTVMAQAAQQTEVSEARNIVMDVKRDLELKNRYFKDRLGVAGVSRGLVKVIVNTLSQDKPEAGLVVYCNAYRWADDARPMKTFPKLSTPTATSMMPGYYRCFASRGQPENRAGDRLVEIGLDGKEEITVDIPILK